MKRSATILFLSIALSAAGETVELLPADSAANWKFYSSGGARATKEVVAVTGMPFTKALRVTNRTLTEKTWNIGAWLPVLGNVKTGDVLLASAWLRSTSDGAKASIAFLSRGDSNNAPLWHPFPVGREWKEYFFPAKSCVDIPKANATFLFHLGFDPQTVEIGPVRLVNYGSKADIRDLPSTRFRYPGQELDAPWRKAAAERIEKHRKANLTVRVVDAAGQPVPNAQVEIELKRPAFGFGTAVATSTLLGKSADNERYRLVLEKYFNKVTLENSLRWNQWALWKQESQKQAGATLDWLAARHIAARGHYLAWGPLDEHNHPRDYKGKPDELRRDLFAHIEEMTRFVGNRVVEWDALNHPIGWGARTCSDECGVQIYADVIRRGRELVPKAEMWINEENNSTTDSHTIAKYLALTKELIRLGAKPDGVGFMGHYKGTLLPSPEAEVNSLADEFGKLGVKLQFTEFDIACGADEEMQADFLRDMLTMAFSRPEFTSFINWGFWERRHWIPAAALWRRDWTMKPAAKVWEDLVLRQWQTHTTGQTGASGGFATRGFLGEYAVKATAGEKSATSTATLTQEGGTVTLTLPRTAGKPVI